MLARWYEVGFLAPLCRNHSENRSYDHEPWRFGTYYEDIVRKYLKLRYRLLPFLYTTLEESHRTGVPLFRPLLLNYQGDENALTIDDEFMIGADLLVAPILKSGQTHRLVYLPKGLWYDYWTGASHPGGTMISVEAPLDTVPLFVRGGGILPLGPEMNHVGEKPTEPMRFQFYPDGDGNASTTFYEDDGASVAYRNGGFRRTTVACVKMADEIRISVSAASGNFQPPARQLEFALRSDLAIRTVLLDGKPLGLTIPTGKTGGWYQQEGWAIVCMGDDRTAHHVQLK